VTYTAQLARLVACPPQNVEGATLRAVLDAAFAENPAVRSYVLDEQGIVRHHVTIFIDGQQVRDRVHLSDPVAPQSQIYVMQALSGG
jgi:sulfur-carrier protein